MALVVVLLALMLVAALGTALAMVASTEARVAATYAESAEVLHAVEAALTVTTAELVLLPDWTPALDGSVGSVLVDGVPGTRTLPDGTTLDLQQATAVERCGLPACTSADMDAVTADRPWGANNPRWQLFAHASLGTLGQAGVMNSAIYLAVWVADDALETDDNPLVDGGGSANPGRGLIEVRARAYGRRGARRSAQASLARTATGARILSWRELPE